MTRIYLDHAATTPLRPEAAEAMRRGHAIWANPSSPHAEGRKARAALEDARERVKTALGWEGECIFTSGASEALAIGLGRAKVERRIVSAVEHDAVFRAAPDAAQVPILPYMAQVDLDRLGAMLAGVGTAVVAVQSLNSETGTLLIGPGSGECDRTIEKVREGGGILLADCSQSAGKLALPTCDMAVISAHKLGGPVGVGALLMRDFALLEPGGGQERGYRQGTENLPGVLGFAAALEVAGQEHWSTTREQRVAFRQEVWGHGSGLILGPQCDWLFSVAHPTLSAQALLIRLDGLGFAVSAGSACSSGTMKKSRVLEAFGIDDATAARTIRVSLGWSTTPAELDAFIEVWRSDLRSA